MAEIHDWYRTPLGLCVAEDERQLLARRLLNTRARTVLQVGAFGDGKRPALFGGARHWVSDQWPGGPVDLAADPAWLPFEAGSIDAIVLLHQLEFHPRPHQVLREAAQVLAPEGHIVVVTFNPLSLWGGRRLLSGRRGGRAPWRGRYFSRLRLEDWLALLGLRVEWRGGLMVRPPVRRSGLLRRLVAMERLAARYGRWLGGVQVTVARRRVVNRQPPAVVLRPRFQVIPGGLAQARSALDQRRS